MEAIPIQIVSPESIPNGRPVVTAATGGRETDASFDRVLSEVSSVTSEQAGNETESTDSEDVLTVSSSVAGALLADWLTMNSIVVPVAPVGNADGQAGEGGLSVEGVGSVNSLGSSGGTTLTETTSTTGRVGVRAGLQVSSTANTVDATEIETSVEASAEQASTVRNENATTVNAISSPLMETEVSQVDESVASTTQPEVEANVSDSRVGSENLRIDGEGDGLASDQNGQQGNSSNFHSGQTGSLTNLEARTARTAQAETRPYQEFVVGVDSSELMTNGETESPPISSTIAVNPTPSPTGAIGDGAHILPVLEKNVRPSDLADSVLQQIDKGIQIISFPRRREVKVTLEPESLGKLNISVVQEKSGVMLVRLVADNPAAKDLIESRLQELKAAFERQGLKIDGFSIDVGQNPAFAGGQPGNRFLQEAMDLRNISNHNSGLEPAREESPRRHERSSLVRGQVDLRI